MYNNTPEKKEKYERHLTLALKTVTPSILILNQARYDITILASLHLLLETRSQSQHYSLLIPSAESLRLSHQAFLPFPDASQQCAILEGAWSSKEGGRHGPASPGGSRLQIEIRFPRKEREASGGYDGQGYDNYSIHKFHGACERNLHAQPLCLRGEGFYSAQGSGHWCRSQRTGVRKGGE